MPIGLKKPVKKYNIAVHAFVLMTNHIHLLATPPKAKNVSLFMQFIGRQYVPYVNHKYAKAARSGKAVIKQALFKKRLTF
jgi:putative transposase